jgi:hypothetical protein
MPYVTRTISRLILVCFTSLIVLLDAQSAVGNQRESRTALRVLVDASKDGGLWWFPQGENFNPREHHQGKALADFMRAKGWNVIEVPRGEVITFETLRDVDIVIRPPAYFSYGLEELMAYQQSVSAGTRLLLMGGSGTKGDALAENFGLVFETYNRFGSVKQWVPHALTTNIEGYELPWTTIRQTPPAAVTLAWLHQLETNAGPVLGYLPYGNGYVLFVGQSLISPAPQRSLSVPLINSLGRFTLQDIRHLPSGALVFAEQSVEPAPQPLEPLSDATLPQPDLGEWRFDWDDVPGGKSYEIVVLGSSAAFPLVRARTRTSDYTFPSKPGYVSESNLLGWTWRVRAQHANGTWGPWSKSRRFNVSPRNLKLQINIRQE